MGISAPSNCNCVAFLKLRKCLSAIDEWRRTAHQSQDGHWKSMQYLLHVWKPSNVHIKWLNAVINNNGWHDNKSLCSMCAIKSIIKGPKLQQMSEGYCLCPAPAPLEMHRMDAHCSCCMPVCSGQARVSPPLSFLLEWEAYSKWALKLTYSRADNTAVRLSPGSIQ